MKKFNNILLILFLILLNFSCSLDVQQSINGSLSFILPESTSSRSSIEIKGDNTLPLFYTVTLESKDENKIIYNMDHKAGSRVNISNVPYGSYEITVRGETPSRIFTDKQSVNVRTERTTCNINLKVEELYGDIKLTIKPNDDYVSYIYTINNGNNESAPHYINYTNSNGNKEVIIKDLSATDTYTLNVYAENSSAFYLMGNTKLNDVKVKGGEVTDIYIESFDMYTGTITLGRKSEKKDIRVSIVEKDSGKLLRTVEPSIFPVVLKGIPPYITYNIIVESLTSDDVSYSVNKDFTLTPGENEQGNIDDIPRSLYYVSENGNDKNLGTKAYPLNTLNAAIKKGGNSKALTIVIQGDLSDSVIVDKPIALTIKGESNSRVDFLRSERNAIKIDNENAHVTIENISVISDKDSIFLNKGNLTLLNDANIKDIKLSPNSYITVGGMLGNSLIYPPIINSDNFSSFTSPIIKVTNDILLENIYDKFELSDTHYMLSPNGIVVINDGPTIPKMGTLNITSSTATPNNLTLSLTNGKETIEKEVTTFPFSIELEEGIWEVTVVSSDKGDRISLPNGQYYKVKGDDITEVPMVASPVNIFYVNGKTGDDNSNTGDLSSPYKTINKALSEIVSIGSERFDFTINVSDTVNEDTEIFINYPINLTISGGENATIKAVNPNGSLSEKSNHRVIRLGHPNANLTLKNVTITGGYINEEAYAPVDYYGSGIRVDNGNITLENTIVRDNGGVLQTNSGEEQVIQSIYLYDGAGTLTLKGSTKVEDGIIELRSGKTINISGDLTNSNVATVLPDLPEHNEIGTVVLTGDTSSNYTKFTLVDGYLNYQIDSEGKIIDHVLTASEFDTLIRSPGISFYEKTVKVNVSQDDLTTLSNTLKDVSGPNNILDEFGKLKLDLSESTFTTLPTNVFAGVYLLDLILPPTLSTIEKEALTNMSYPDGTAIENVYFTDLTSWVVHSDTSNTIVEVSTNGSTNKALFNKGGGLYSNHSTKFDSASSAAKKITEGQTELYVSLQSEADYTTLNDALKTPQEKTVNINLYSAIPYIPSNAFANSTCLGTITIPNNILMIGKDAFNGSNVTTIKMEDSESYWAKKGDSVRFKPSTSSIQASDFTSTNNKDLYKMIESSGFNIENYVSDNIYAAIVVDKQTDYAAIAETIKNMKGNALHLYIISIADIPSNAFDGCDKLKSVHIGSGVTSIGENAFINSGVTSITFESPTVWNKADGSTVELITDGNENCRKINSANSPLTTTVSLDTLNAILTNREVIDMYLPNSNIRFKITNPDEFTSLKQTLKILDGTFISVGLDISSSTSLTSIPQNALSETPISNLIIPTTVTAIGDNAFYNCKSLGGYASPFTIPATITEIGKNAFTSDDPQYSGISCLIFEDTTSTWNLSGVDSQTYTPTQNKENDAVALRLTYKDYTWTKQN